MIKIRSGIGYDIHRLAKGSGLFVGGIKVSGKLKAVAHSDGDVLIHSLIDSLFGAIGERDIGQQFPGTDPQYRGIRSSVLLARTREIVEKNNYEILNIDAVVVAENVKIADYKEGN